MMIDVLGYLWPWLVLLAAPTSAWLWLEASARAVEEDDRDLGCARGLVSAVVIMATVAAVAVAGLALLSRPADAAEPCPPAVAHRGVTQGGATEESVAAEVDALPAGAAYAEVDAQASSDGVLYVMHDYTVDRTTDGTGTLRQMTSRQVDRLHLDDGSRVPRLADVLAALRPTGLQVFVEVKAPGRGTYADLQRLVRGFGTSRVVVNSFHADRLDRVRRVLPHVRLSLDSGARVAPSVARRYGSVTVLSSALNGAYVASLGSAVRTYAYGMPETAEGYASLPFGVGVLTDDVAAYRAWCGS